MGAPVHDGINVIVPVHPRCGAVVSQTVAHCGTVILPGGACPAHPYVAAKPDAPRHCRQIAKVETKICQHQLTGDGKPCPKHSGCARYHG